MPRETVNCAVYGGPPFGGYSHSVRAPIRGTLISVAGLTARNPDGTVGCPGDPAGQTRMILATLGELLERSGAGLGDLVRVVTYLRRIDDHPAVHGVRREVFGDLPPASTTVELPALSDPQALVQIDALAIAD